MKKIFLILIIVLCFPSIVLAQDITDKVKIQINNNNIDKKITDKNENSYIKISNSDVINITSDEDIYGLYIIYELSSKEGTISNSTKTFKIGTNNFLHEYIDINNNLDNSKEISIKYDENVMIAEIYVLSEGEIPEFVEIWNKPCDEADLLLFSTHSDDEQLFFLGLLPTYVAKGANVQVVYFTNHNDNPKRLHEQLHGLYTVGIRNYPVMGLIPDAWSNSLDGAINNLKNAKLTEEDAMNFQIEMIRRFKPLVIVGHDENGEYKHGQHMLNTYLLKKAVEYANNSEYHQDSYNNYGLWNTPKLYLHLYKENQIVMDYDTPLDYFNGKTAYEVSKEGYKKHNSQQWTWFTKWINGKNNEYTKSTDITTYSPNQFGLYRSLVGEDIYLNDMFENLTMRKDIKKELPAIDNTIVKPEKNSIDYKYFIYPFIVILCILTVIVVSRKRKKQ